MIKEIFETFSPSGNEECIRKLLKKQLGNMFEKIETDNLGNLIAVSGDGSLCIECGMDTSGVMVVSKTDTRAYFASVGGIKPAELAGRKIVFDNGCTGVVKYDDEPDLQTAKVSDLYIEMDTTDISIGDFGAVVTEFREDECGFSGYGLKNHIGMAVVCGALKAVEKVENITVLFSAQKRLGARGIRTFFGTNSFGKVITVDACGNDGCVVLAKDSKAVASVGIRSELEERVARNELDAQTAISDDDFYIEQVLISNNLCGAIGISVLCEDEQLQRINKTDFDTAVKLLTAVLNR